MKDYNENNSKPFVNEIKRIIERIKTDYEFLNLSPENIFEICIGGGGIRKQYSIRKET